MVELENANDGRPAERREDRHEDRGRDARRPLKKRRRSVTQGWTGHLTVGGLLSLILGGGGFAGFRDLNTSLALQAAGLEALTRTNNELVRRFDEQGKSIEQLRLTLERMQARGEASDKAVERTSLEVAALAKEVVDLGKQAQRATDRADDHERRIQTLEQKGK